jgi:hypothetical protein
VRAIAVKLVQKIHALFLLLTLHKKTQTVQNVVSLFSGEKKKAKAEGKNCHATTTSKKQDGGTGSQRSFGAKMSSLSEHGRVTRAVAHTGRMGNVSLERSTRKCEVQGVLGERKTPA